MNLYSVTLSGAGFSFESATGPGERSGIEGGSNAHLACGAHTRAKWRKPRRGPGLSERGSRSLGCRSARLGRWGEPEVGKDGAGHEVKADVNPTDRHQPEGVVEEDADNAERQ